MAPYGTSQDEVVWVTLDLRWGEMGEVSNGGGVGGRYQMGRADGAGLGRKVRAREMSD